MTAVRIFMVGLLSSFVSSSSSIPELTCHGVGRGLDVNPCGGEDVAKAWYGQLVSLENQLTDHVSALSLSWQILLMFQADWPIKGFPSPKYSAARPCQVRGVT